jgi:hypothetical protein
MSRLGKFEEILAQYRRHGWRLARVLARPGTFAAQGAAEGGASYEGAPVVESEADAMWFTRPSAEGREAWELRLVGEPPYALFELFEPDEAEEDREDVRREMEARLREHAGVGDAAEAADVDGPAGDGDEKVSAT